MLADLRALNEVQARHPALRGAVAQVAQVRRRLESELRPLRRRAVWQAIGLAILALACLSPTFTGDLSELVEGWPVLARLAAALMSPLLFLVLSLAHFMTLECYQRRAARLLAQSLAPLLGHFEDGDPPDFLASFVSHGLLPAEGHKYQEFRLRLGPGPDSPRIISLAYYDERIDGYSFLWLLSASLPDACIEPRSDLRSDWPRHWHPRKLRGRRMATGDADFDQHFRCYGDTPSPAIPSSGLRHALSALRAAGGPVAAHLQDGSLLLAWKRKRRNFRELPLAGSPVGERSLPRLLHDWGLLLDVAAAWETSAAKRAPPAAR